MDLPEHPETDDTARDRQPATAAKSWGTALMALLGALLALLVILHLTGVVGPAR